MSHVGSSLRRLRLESGVSLRDLARRLGVSSAYLSRVENGLDAAPTPERLEAIATELGLPAAMLLEAGHRTSPLVTRYVEHQPQAAALFFAIARAQLEPEELFEVQRFVERRFKREANQHDSSGAHRLAPLLKASTVVLGVRCDDLEDAYEIGCVRLADVLRGPSAAQLTTAVRMRAQVIDPILGDGVAVVSLTVPGTRPCAALVVLATPQTSDVGDGVPIQVVLLLMAPAGRDALLRVAHVARLASRGLAMELAQAGDMQEAIDRVAGLELVD